MRALPGLGLCAAVTLAALALDHAEAALFGRAWLEPLVLAILIGTAIRTAWAPGARWRPGIDFAAKTLLELAVVLLGASLSAATVLAIGPLMLLGIAGVVAVAILASYGIGRLLGLSVRMALLVACGNSICGNSAIAAVAPVIGADGDDVAASIAFTAVLGVWAVLGLPLLAPLLDLTGHQYGVLAGLTVYAVPQVLAATAPVAAIAVQVGTLVKLVRVLMLGPVILALSLLLPQLRQETDAPTPRVTAGDRPKPGRAPLHRLVPWFILGFLGMVALRSLGLIPDALMPSLAAAATALTVVSMAALGLGVDMRAVARAGGSVTAAAVLSLVALGTISLGLIRLLGVA
ncbi:putative sulfate exporter family transporter [Roseicella frigidaeris]|uniref:Putative sulfate exporter family transporter n=1 Tax=Roseicella frigidaeris TaxID=2230885 RepID=A0A327M471_9PROT|nr:putative sulfate exporter family transporter [Roseicella frigidaeris]RAI57074.1 putative sulfate exporter family transporter [Roseicella frigidaeris]